LEPSLLLPRTHSKHYPEDLRQVFRTDDPDDTPEEGWDRWQRV